MAVQPLSDELVSVEEHLALILDTIAPLAPLRLGLQEAHGCQLAEDVTAPMSLPPFDNSSMDGYAVRHDDVAGASAGAPVTLPVIADLAAGTTQVVRLQPGLCVRIMTGAPVPEGTDAVVPVEWTDAGVDRVQIRRPPERDAFIRRAAEDVTVGATVLSAGVRLGSAQIALLAAVGRIDVLVHPRPRVVVISTGSELVAGGEALGPGKIFDSNSHALAAACREAGAQPYRIGIVPDDPTRMQEVLEDHLIQADAVITSGGVSVGAYDIVKEVLSREGKMTFRRVAMQPGMPQGFGTVGQDEIPLFALPGNPVSSLVSFEVFVRPALRRMLGAGDLQRPTVGVRIAHAWDSPAGKRQYVRVRLSSGADGEQVATPVGGAGSHLVAAMASAQALLVVPEAVTHVEAGSRGTAMLLDRRAL